MAPGRRTRAAARGRAPRSRRGPPARSARGTASRAPRPRCAARRPTANAAAGGARRGAGRARARRGSRRCRGPDSRRGLRRAEPVERGRDRPQPARYACPRGLLADPEAARHLGVVELLDHPQAHGVALLGGKLGERARDRRTQLAQCGQLLDPRELLAVERRRLHAGTAHRAALGVTAAQRLVEHVARDPERPNGERVAVVRVAGGGAAAARTRGRTSRRRDRPRAGRRTCGA